MTDINFSSSPATRPSAADAGPEVGGSEPHWEMIELLFFAYRDFIGDPDAILGEYNFGRAHHRVLHFVNRNPGLSVAELLQILKITKQSLGRVLRELIEGGFIEQRTGATDRRQRLLHTTPAGRDLALRLAEPQSKRIAAALSALGPDGATAAREYLRLLINPEERAQSVRFAGRK